MYGIESLELGLGVYYTLMMIGSLSSSIVNCSSMFADQH